MKTAIDTVNSTSSAVVADYESAFRTITKSILAADHRIKIEYMRSGTPCADIAKKTMYVLPMNALTDEELIKARTFYYHEGGHLRFSRAIKEEDLAVPGLDRPSRAVKNIWNALEDTRMEAEVASHFAGAAGMFQEFRADYCNIQIAKRVAESGGKVAPLWEALCAMMFTYRMIPPAWTLTPRAKQYFDAAYDTFTRVRECKTPDDALLLAREIYQILKDLKKEEVEEDSSDEGEPGKAGESDGSEELEEPKEKEKKSKSKSGSDDLEDKEEETDSDKTEDGDSEDSDEKKDGKDKKDGKEKKEKDTKSKKEKKESKDKKESKKDNDGEEDGDGKDEKDAEDEGEKEDKKGSKKEKSEDDGEDDSEDGGSESEDGDDGEEEKSGNDDGEESEEDGDSDGEGESDDKGDVQKESDSGDETENEKEGDSEKEASGSSKEKRGKHKYDPTDHEVDSKKSETKTDIDAELDAESEGEDMVEAIAKELAAIAEKHEHDYASITDRDEFRVPPLNPEDHQKFQKEYKEVSTKAMQLTQSLEQAIRVMTASRKIGHMPRGKLDVHRLAGLISGLDKRIFSRKDDGMDLDVGVSILVDESGSMTGCMEDIRKLAIILGEALESIGVPFEMVGHTSTMDDGGRLPEGVDRSIPILIDIIKTFNESWKNVRARAIHLRAQSQNVDGEALGIAVRRIKPRREKRKIVFVLSDGYPESGQGNNAMLGKHLRKVAKDARKDGVEVYAFGIATRNPEPFYDKDNFIYMESVENISQDFIRELVRIISRGKLQSN